jgi:hypothetical protein
MEQAPPESRFGSHEVVRFMRAARKAWSTTAGGGWTELHDKRKPRATPAHSRHRGDHTGEPGDGVLR